MKYQALYRKYRPKTFDDVYGQQIVVQTLKNVIKNNKLTHAYLFVGPRGTGKTSIAKIFAKTINCLHPEDGLSCEKCDICVSNNLNENVDIIEMDAASNNGVDEIREIRNHITLLPTVSKYKIYIIDEVHMLTTGAFNALLKTLEEPPEHIIFILATTEPHKIPLTIMSRCQSFEFKPIPVATIKERLKYICAQENINIDDKSLNLIAEESNGGLRDAVSMLDQLNAYADGNIKYEDVLLLNGRINDDEIEKFMTEMVNDDLNSVFTKIESWQEEGKNFIYICEDFIRFLRNELIKFKLENNSNIVNLIGENKTIEVIMILNKISNDMKISKDKKVLFDVTIINITNILKNKQMFENNTYTSKNIKIENKTPEKVEIKEEKPQTMEVPIKETKNYTLYDELMNIRLNNTLGIADKKSKIEYENAVENLKNDISDLNKLKIINLLDDTKITAGSKDGIILTTDSDNILHDLYDNMELLEESLESLLGKKVKVCILLDELWNKKRIIYVEKIKNKEKIDIIDEEDILNKIKSLNTGEKSEFDDLLEIGGE
jgi:DNA polymerase-3 subunit gamma/tau